MDIVIRTDSSVHIGLGHVMRCLVLARELKNNGHNIEFVTRPQHGDSIDYIRREGFLVHELPQPKECLTPRNTSDYAAWLQVPVELDAEQFVSLVKGADVVIVDHYALGAVWQKEVKNRLNCKIVVIDDLVRKHDADLIIDQTLMRTTAEYKLINGTSHILTGCDYALLNPQFIAKREQALENNSFPIKPTILLSMGGIDKDNVTLQVLKVLQSQLHGKARVTVLLGSKSPSYKKVKDFCSSHVDWIEHIDFVDNMAEIMLTHSLAIGAPGTTSWERACLGIPSIIIPLADNQRTIAKNLVTANASILVEKEDITRNLVSSYKALIKHWCDFRQANLNLCDGLGVRRVVKSVDNLFVEQANILSLVRACEGDIKQVFTWQCHPETRKYALKTTVPSWKEHEGWMKQKLKSVEDFFYMIKSSEDNESVGVIRLDRVKKAEYIVSIFVSPTHYGQRVAQQALNFIDDIHKDVTLHATVLKANIASQRLFTVANYQRVSTDTFIRLPIT
jgi:UDP-2,4-diacetamido-2,4,6-trideoxy-beta-L-altropyranose hydrolase